MISQAREGWFSRVRARLFGSKDPIQRQLDAVAHEGAHLARFAHGAAFAMLVLFSAGSLVALAGDSIQQIAAGNVTIPAMIAAGVSGLLVLAMDTGLLYAASTIRLLASRRAPRGDFAVHWVVLVGVSVLESATYGYMSWKYEAPQGFAWLLIGARAAAAPLLSVYLSLARPLPVTARDMLALAERISGEAVLRDLGILSSDPTATLAEKVGLYLAAALLTPSDRTRLDALLEVAKQIIAARQSDMPLSVAEKPDTTPPTGPGTPTRSRVRTPDVEAPGVLQLPTRRRTSNAAAQGRSRASKRSNAPGVRTPAAALTESVEAKVREHWKPGMSVGQLQRAAGVSRNAAGKYRKVLLAEAENVARVVAQEDAEAVPVAPFAQ